MLRSVSLPETAVPLLSVVIPALRADAELRRCVDSVRLALPAAGNCEILIVLPGRCVADAQALCPGARVLPESRPSLYGAMNDGVAASTGRYLYFLGQDDVLLPSVREVMRMLAREPLAAVFTSVYWGSEGVRRGHASKWRILFANVCQQGIVYSREAVLANGPFLRRLRVQADHLMNIKILWDERTSGRIRHVPLPIAWYAATGLSFRTRDTVFHRVHAAIIGRYLGPLASCLWRGYRWLRPEKAAPGP